jgi:hypothetical protein
MGSIKPDNSPGALQRDNDEMIGFCSLKKKKKKNTSQWTYIVIMDCIFKRIC